MKKTFHQRSKERADRRRARVVKARQAGMKWREIAAMLGVSYQRAQQIYADGVK